MSSDEEVQQALKGTLVGTQPISLSRFSTTLLSHFCFYFLLLHVNSSI
jgi:hypothetical protein